MTKDQQEEGSSAFHQQTELNEMIAETYDGSRPRSTRDEDEDRPNVVPFFGGRQSA